MNRRLQCGVVPSGSMQSHDVASVRCRGEVVHLLDVTGPTPERRLPPHQATGAAYPAREYIGILDNSLSKPESTVAEYVGVAVVKWVNL